MKYGREVLAVSSIKKILLSENGDYLLKKVFLNFESIRMKLADQRPKIMVMGEEKLLKGASEECEAFFPLNYVDPAPLDICNMGEHSPDAWLDPQVNFAPWHFPQWRRLL